MDVPRRRPPVRRGRRGHLGSHLSRSHPTRPATAGDDTWIAACCLVYGLPLATGNVKDFADYAEHEGLELITE
jgi:predicted nucleic acid-binding protein